MNYTSIKYRYLVFQLLVLFFIGSTKVLAGQGFRYVDSENCPDNWSYPGLELVKNNLGHLVDKMGKWQITNISDRHVLMGYGYGEYGVIKQSKANSSWCVSNNEQVSIVYPSIIDRTQLVSMKTPGTEGQCNNDSYRPLTYSEARLYLPSIIQQLPMYYIGNISDGWAVYGRGYNYGAGLIKKNTSDKTLCYPISPRTATNLNPQESWFIGEGNKDIVSWELVTNKDNFIRPWRFFQYLLGYSHVRGDDTQDFHSNIKVTRIDDGFRVEGLGHETQKSNLEFKNLSFVIDADTFKHGLVVEGSKTKIKTVSTNAFNNTNEEQTVIVGLSVNETNSWSKTDTYQFGQKLTINKSWSVPQVSSISVNAEISASQSWSSQNGGSNSTTTQLQARVKIPPFSYIPVKIDIYEANVSYPYSFLAKAIYDIHLSGEMNKNYNSSLTNPKGGWNSQKFTIGYYENKDSSLNDIWINRAYPGVNEVWDLSQTVNLYGFDETKELIEKLLSPAKTKITGNIYAKEQSAGEIILGNVNKIKTNKEFKKDKVYVDNDMFTISYF